MMSTTAAEIETIIRIVLERLRAMQAAPPALVPEETPQAKANEATLRLDRKLVTLEQLKNRLTGMQVLEVPRRAIVTPAVVDELRARGVKLRRRAAAGPALGSADLGSADRGGTLLVAPQAKHLPRSSVALLAETPRLEAMLPSIASHVAVAGRGAIWCSTQPFAAALAAKSHVGLRAIQLANLSDLPCAMEQANPNVLILDDRHWSAASLANLSRKWKVNA